MLRLSDLETRFGLTRADVTVALFLAATALVGFIYVTFFDTRAEPAPRELAHLLAYRDSALAARDRARRAALARLDSAAPWEPADAEDHLSDSLGRRAAEHRESGTGKAPPPAPVDINHAPVSELMRLPGVGEKTARAIVQLRSHVPFRRPEDLMNVKGIGEKKFEKMRPFILIR
jgi:competence ComEA-like helix-hairpin-helix protein